MARINCDVDGVVADFVPHLFGTLRAKGFEPKPIGDPSWRTWDIFDVMDEEMRACAFDLLANHHWWRSMPVVPYAKEAIRALREAGHHVQWVTTAWDECFGWRDARRDWLGAHFDDPVQNIKKDLTVAACKGEIWADVFIDDKPSHILDWHAHHKAAGHRGILYKTRFNEDHHDDLEHIEWSPASVEMVIDWLAEKYYG